MAARLAPILGLIIGLKVFGAGILLAPDGNTLYVANPDSGSVSAVDTLSLQKTDEALVGKDPRSLVLSADGGFLYVTCQGAGIVAILRTRPLRLVEAIPVGAEPYDIVADKNDNLYITSTATSTVMFARALPRFRGRPFGFRAPMYTLRATISVSSSPKGLLLSHDERHLYVTHFLRGQVSVVDTTTLTISSVISTGLDSNMAQRIVLHPNGITAYLPHIRSNTSNPSLLFDNTVFPVVSAIDLNAAQLLPSLRIDLSLGQTAVNLPFDIAFSPDGLTAYVVGLGSGDVSVIDLQNRRRIARIDVGDGPRAIAVTKDGHWAYVSNTLSGDVSVIDLQSLAELRRVPVTSNPLPAQVLRGKVLFFSSRSTDTSRDRWMSCATCHFEGEHDGRTWFTALGIRNTPSLRGVSDTRPIHWSGDRDEVQDFEFTIRELQAGTGLMRDRAPNPPLGAPNAGLSADLDALAAFVDTLRPKPNPFFHDLRAVHRGRRIFERADTGCASCHPAPRYTDSAILPTRLVHDVGTGDGPNEPLGPAFDTPSLRALWDSAPYLHDGSAPTIRDVLTTHNPFDRHGRTSHLTVEELNDLEAFLGSL